LDLKYGNKVAMSVLKEIRFHYYQLLDLQGDSTQLEGTEMSVLKIILGV